MMIDSAETLVMPFANINEYPIEAFDVGAWVRPASEAEYKPRTMIRHVIEISDVSGAGTEKALASLAGSVYRPAPSSRYVPIRVSIRVFGDVPPREA